MKEKSAAQSLGIRRREKRRLYTQMENFVVVNGRILDFGKYEADFSMMQKIIVLDMKEYFIKLGFKQKNASINKDFQKEFSFYNKELDFGVTIATNKKQGLQFI